MENFEIETHPHLAFVPKNCTTLIMGSFPGRDQTHKLKEENDWFYGTKRNQFWKILEGVYQINLKSKKDKQLLFTDHGIGIVDIFYKIQRTGANNADTNLVVVEYNTQVIQVILKQRPIRSILFTSKLVQKTFQQLFPACRMGQCLPSPSPRYASMSLNNKIEIYKNLLPD